MCKLLLFIISEGIVGGSAWRCWLRRDIQNFDASPILSFTFYLLFTVFLNPCFYYSQTVLIMDLVEEEGYSKLAM